MALNFLDLTSNHNNLTNSGAVASTSVPFLGTANSHSLDLEASSSQYAYVADNAPLSITGDMTIEAWVKFESLPSSTAYAGIANRYLSTGENRSFTFSLYNSAGTYSLYLINSANGTGASVLEASVTWTPSTATWYHLACVYTASAGSVKFYVNGIQQGATQTGLNTSQYNGTADFQIGSAFNGSSFLDGLIDDVRVWNDVRTAQEISDNFTKELAGNEANLAGYWKLNNDYQDATSNNNDLTASGSPAFSTDTGFSSVNTDSVDLERTDSDYLYVADTASLSVTGDISIEAWIKLEQLPSTASGAMVIASKYDTNAAQSYGFEIGSSDTLGFYFSHTAGQYSQAHTTAAAFTSADIGVWRHIAVTADVSAGGSGIVFYKNGVSLATTVDLTQSTSIADTNVNFTIGGYHDSGGYFDGLIDEVRVWNDIRTVTEINNNMTRELTGSETNLVGYWNFDDSGSSFFIMF